MKKTFASLLIPNYLIYFVGLLITNIGSWIASTAKQWLIFKELSNGNAVALGALTAVIFAPALFLAPVAGLIADRFPKKRIMLVAQVLIFCTATALAVLVISGQIQMWHLFVLTLIDGCISAIVMPAQQAFVSDLVPRKNLSNAIGLNSTSFNSARLIGPALAGLMIMWFSTGVTLAIAACTSATFFLALLKIDDSQVRHVPLARGRGQLKEGIAYVTRRPDLMLLLAIAFMMGNFGFNFTISNAVMATQVFGKGPGEFGILGSAMGVGALLAALFAAYKSRPRLRHIFIALAVFTVASVASALAPSYLLFAITLVPLGFTAIMTNLTANSLLQLGTEDAYRGRVMTIWTALLVGGTTFVSPFVGWIGNEYGARATVWFEGISIALTFIVASAYVLRRSNLQVRFDRHARLPWIRLERGNVTESVTDPTK